MKNSQMWTTISLLDEEKDGMTIGSIQYFIEGK